MAHRSPQPLHPQTERLSAATVTADGPPGASVTEPAPAKVTDRGDEVWFRAIFETIQDPIFLKNCAQRYTRANPAVEKLFGLPAEEVIGRTDWDLFGELAGEHVRQLDARVLDGEVVQEEHIKVVNGIPITYHVIKTPMRDSSGQIVGICGIAHEISERKRAEDALRRSNRELALLNRASQALISTLDLDEILITVLEEMRHLLEVVACSIWLLKDDTDEWICQQFAGPQSESVLGYRVSPGEGIIGWVATRGESIVVPDLQRQDRYLAGMAHRTGLALRSALGVPLKVKERVIGVLQVVDTEIDRFRQTDLVLIESLATTAAIAIERAQLYERTRQDAEMQARLLREVNHRVKNNLSAIIGLLYAEQGRAGLETDDVYHLVMQDLINRVQGLATVHGLLSASGWAPLRLSDLARQIIRSALQILPRGKHISVDVSPSPILITPEQAHSLAVVINELATNAAKHSLGQRDTGHIVVRIGHDGREVALEFRDDGPGCADDVLRAERPSVGFDLVRNIVRKDLQGSLALYNDKGTVAVIRFQSQTRAGVT